uniref:Uncharacterized protein n=1 Tax=Anguilla anguilla TaxID=7936 RepID=A0A0E9RGZ4_ANGAN
MLYQTELYVILKEFLFSNNILSDFNQVLGKNTARLQRP